MSEASGNQGLWTEAKYPGDTVRIFHVKRGGERGEVRIQQYETFARVGMFLPGVVECSPGDTPKTWPEFSVNCKSSFAANEVFDDYVQRAFAQGWERDYGRGD